MSSLNKQTFKLPILKVEFLFSHVGGISREKLEAHESKLRKLKDEYSLKKYVYFQEFIKRLTWKDLWKNSETVKICSIDGPSNWSLFNYHALKSICCMKIIIIGAGPAGLSSAYWGSRNGHEIIVFERERSYNKPCGEGVPREIFNMIPLKPRHPIISNEVRGLHIYFQDEHVKEIKRGVEGYILNKKIFLEELKEIILNNGGKVFYGTNIVDINPESGKVVDSKGNIYTADLIIDAGGHFSVTQRKGFLNYKGYRLIPVSQCRCEIKDMDHEKIHLNYYRDGYSWVFFKDEKIANVGVGRLHTNVKKFLEKIVREKGFKRISNIEVNSVSIGGVISQFSYKKLRVVGEAAGMVFPHTGEGIRPSTFAGKIVLGEDYEQKFMRDMGMKIQRYRRFLNVLLSKFMASDIKNLISVIDGRLATKLLHGEKYILNLKMLTKPNLILKLLPFVLKTK